jgi:hypothetical protein
MPYQYPPIGNATDTAGTYPQGNKVLDLVLTGGATAAQAALTAAGFTTTTGSGGTFDAVLGYNGNGTESRRFGSAPTWATTVPTGGVALQSSAEFTVLVQVRRGDVSKNITTNTANLYDSDGPLPAGSTVMLYANDSGSGNFFGCQIEMNGASGGISQSNLRLNAKANDANSKTCTLTLNSHFSPLYDDPNGFIEIGFSCQNGRVTWLLDGWPVAEDTVAASFAGAFVRGSIGSQAGSNFMAGWVRRVRIYNRAVRYNYATFPKVGFYGDSFVQRGTERANATTDTVSDILAVQNELSDANLTNSGTNRHWSGLAAPNVWGHIMQRWAAASGNPFRIYNAARSGYGWTSVTGVPIPLAYRTALGNWSAEVIVALGSVNDVTANYSANLITDTKAMLDSLITLNPRCRRILFVQTFPNRAGVNGWSTAQYAQFKDHIERQQGLDGYSNGIVKFVPTFNPLGADNFDPRFNSGTYPGNTSWSGYLNDIHPAGWGMLRMAEIIWPFLRAELQGV